MPNFRVQFAERGPVKETTYGAYAPIKLLLDDSGNMVTCEWYAKADTPLPEQNSHIEGYLEDGPYGKKFKRQPNAGGGGGGGASRPRMSPAEEARIVRQSAQKAAVGYVQALAAAGRWTGSITDVKAMIDWFYADSMEKRDG